MQTELVGLRNRAPLILLGPQSNQAMLTAGFGRARDTASMKGTIAMTIKPGGTPDCGCATDSAARLGIHRAAAVSEEHEQAGSGQLAEEPASFVLGIVELLGLAELELEGTVGAERGLCPEEHGLVGHVCSIRLLLIVPVHPCRENLVRSPPKVDVC